ncbi:MAG: relaxase/mobilization nuclease domain-containing protein [Sphingobacteriales bacterium]|nr:relaxase/mobilization nuclease domain-containing protein [Sphingobacteriales bacterium]OJV98413.1 MAG: relaxase [Sphingobacteriales bacterium 44-61]
MVAVIHSSKSLRNVLNYNEQKVQQKQARCLTASGYPKDVEDLNFYQKLNRLTNLAALNTRTTVNSVHISLNFDVSEKLAEETLQQIASAYMEKIGFGDQPYLVYQHLDAGHPHLHIVSTNIKANGKRLELHNLGRNQSEKARKEIERDFGLIRADSRKLKEAYQVKAVSAQKIRYGKSETRRAITNVLDTVLNQYKYSSLAELNAILKLYNVVADRGGEASRTFQKNGLVYRVLDEKGEKVGVPIKSSLIHSKPTLKYLEKRFLENEPLKQKEKQRLKTAIDWIFHKMNKPSIDGLIKALEKERVSVVLRQNTDGLIYGITYVDHQTKSVFNGSDLGKPYSAKGLQERCSPGIKESPSLKGEPVDVKQGPAKQVDEPAEIKPSKNPANDNTSSPIATPKANDYIPYQLKRNKKKKRKKRIRF